MTRQQSHSLNWQAVSWPCKPLSQHMGSSVHKIELTQRNLEIVMGALSELPFKISAPVISDINRQLTQAPDDKPDEVKE